MAWIDSNWTYRKKITIASAKVSGTHVNFPITINGTDTDLKHTGSGGHVGKTDGTDILFTLSDGTTQLKHEVEQYVQASGKIVMHVKMPTLSDVSDVDIYMYYGYAAASDQQDVANTWDANYMFVLHMDQDPSVGDLLDSTTNGRDFTPYGTMTSGDLVDTTIGKGIDFDGSNDGAENLTAWNILGSPDVTTESVFNVAAAPGSGHYNLVTANGAVSAQPACLLRIKSSPAGSLESWGFINGGARVAQSAVIPYNQDNYGACSWIAGEGIKVNLNSAHVTSAPVGGTFTRGSDNWEIADWSGSGTQHTNGIISETRVSNSKRSMDWQDTTYETLINPGTFYSTDVEETETPVGPPLQASGLQDTFFPDVDPHDGTTKDLFSNDDHGDSFFDVISCFERDVSFDIINEFSKDTSWDILNDFMKDTSWCTLNDFAKLIAWDIIKDYNQGTSWHIFDANIESIANFILKYIESNFDIIPSWEDPISNFSLKTLQTSFTLREPITTNFKLVGIRDNIITP